MASVSSGCHKKYTDWAGLKQPEFILHNSGAWQIPHPVASQRGSLVRVSPCLAGNCLLTMSSRGRKKKLWSLFLLPGRMLVSSRGPAYMTSFKPNCLPKAHFPISHRSLGLQYTHLGGHTYSVRTTNFGSKSLLCCFTCPGASAKAWSILSLNSCTCKTRL